MRVIDLSRGPDAWTFARFGQACRDLGVTPRHVLHVGGHLGQEYRHYRAAGAQVTYMEPTPANAQFLRASFPDATVIEAAAGGQAGMATLKLCGGDGCWNTVRAAIGTGDGVHQSDGSVDVAVVRIADVQADANVLVVDTQGTEIDALAGADLSRVDLVIVETQASGHPEAAHIDDVNAHMAARGWTPVLAWNHERPSRPHHTFADVFYQSRKSPTLSVLIATLGQRGALLARLLDGLMPQVDKQDGRVRVIAYWDNGESHIADKRQALVEATTTDYLCFVDDDDTVTGDYVEEILRALESWPDYVGLWMMVHKDGEPHRRAELSLKHRGWFDGPEYYCRDITHENPIRTSIAKSVDFRDKPAHEPEDTPWAAKLRGRLKTEAFIDKVLYHYWWIPGQSAWINPRRAIRRTAPDRQPWRPIEVDSQYFSWHPASTFEQLQASRGRDDEARS